MGAFSRLAGLRHISGTNFSKMQAPQLAASQDPVPESAWECLKGQGPIEKMMGTGTHGVFVIGKTRRDLVP